MNTAFAISTLGDVEMSMFKSRYKDMLDKAIPNLTKAQQEYCKAHLDSNECVGNPPTPKTSDEVFANLYNATIKGVSVKGKLDLHAMTSKLPDGLEMTLVMVIPNWGNLITLHPKMPMVGIRLALLFGMPSPQRAMWSV